MPNSDTILVIGSNGQIGTELVFELRRQFGADRVIASDVSLPDSELSNAGPYETLDVLDRERLGDIVDKYKITQIYHLAALLSVSAEKKPKMAWNLNINGLLNILELSREKGIQKIFFPSTIAVFGPSTPKDQTPQQTVMDPNTVYGISKLAGERWCEYYFLKYGLDIRSIRYPGLISHKAMPGGGTTDYAVHIFYDALHKHSYDCFLSENTTLPMMYMPDAIRGTIEIMQAPKDKIKLRSGYNFSGFSFSPKEIANEIKKRIPDFTCTYQPDFRQLLADTWPRSIDDAYAREHWGWKSRFDLRLTTEDMLKNVQQKMTENVKV